METVKKQADAITDLESELSKAKKQERSYEEAIEQLQADLDTLEQDNARLKAAAPGPERQGKYQFMFDVGIAKIKFSDSFRCTARRCRACCS